MSSKKKAIKKRAAAAHSTSDIATDRSHRQRMRTRLRLIDAAQKVMGIKGVELATIAEIAEAADVGFGSFYNHFSSKEQIANEVLAVRAEEFARELEVIMQRVPDIGLAVSFVQRWFIERGRRDPVWGWFVIHADSAVLQMEFTFRERIRRDIQHGVEIGRFDVKGIDTAVTITVASLLAVLRKILEGKLSPGAVNEMVDDLLRMYGVSREEAYKLAHARLPDWIGRSHA